MFGSWLKPNRAPSSPGQWRHWLCCVDDHYCLPDSLLQCLGLSSSPGIPTKLSGQVGLGAILINAREYDFAFLPQWRDQPSSRASRAPPLKFQSGRLIHHQVSWLGLATILTMRLNKAAGWDYYLGVPRRNLVCQVPSVGYHEPLSPSPSQFNS